jgi:arginine N-succinyltransferase
VLILRPVETGDLEDLVALAQQLDSVNLPADRDLLEERVAQSRCSFAEEIGDWRDGNYVFMLEDTEAGRCVGTSMVRAKHGTPDAPYYYLEVSTEERRSTELARHVVHTRLQLRLSTNGPTELGGIVLDPAYRGHPGKCGKALSIVRFAFISAHPDRFEREVVAEMLSRFDARGHNRLWDAFGARFTGLSYREADHLSARNPRFIADLFPLDPVYATLFPDEVQAVIGEPNQGAKAAVRILEKVGFHYLNRVDPFDGGPYYGAARDTITSVRERRELVLPSVPAERVVRPAGPLALLSAEGTHGFRAAVLPLDEEGAPFVPKQVREVLGVGAGDRVSVTPLP